MPLCLPGMTHTAPHKGLYIVQPPCTLHIRMSTLRNPLVYIVQPPCTLHIRISTLHNPLVYTLRDLFVYIAQPPCTLHSLFGTLLFFVRCLIPSCKQKDCTKFAHTPCALHTALDGIEGNSSSLCISMPKDTSFYLSPPKHFAFLQLLHGHNFAGVLLAHNTDLHV